ncbi:MAG: [FeFe] hydrogenase H-cluster radical SAM maturase HydE [Planctomycetes bacterium]|nr:[FeFe] hydrogenase H-cluster radical SAM maturase HydE [Planctomycetota bacterium]
MNPKETQLIINRVYNSALPEPGDLVKLLNLDYAASRSLFVFADQVRERFVGDEILIRGIVEVSNYCRNNCAYCGLNRGNLQLPRYRLSEAEIMECVGRIYETGIKTVVMQSGEDEGFDPRWLASLIKRIKHKYNLAITLSVGETSRENYRLWKFAGAERFLMKIETTDRDLYQSLHPGMSLQNRVRCLHNHDELGYQTGSGCMIGLPGQTPMTLASDLQFFKKMDFDMLGIGPFIPHPETPLGNIPAGNMETVYKMLALARIVSRRTHLPATTAVSTLSGREATRTALQVGANVVMINFTPEKYHHLYEIYPRRKGVSEWEELSDLENIAMELGRKVNYSKGDAIKNVKEYGFAVN